MFRRLCISASLLVAGALLVPATALGWSNGPAVNGLEGEGYGTHDWVLDEAVQAAGSQASWLDAEVARRATDDPDSQRMDSAWHLYRDKGISRGAPYKVGELYEQAIAAYHAGDRARASFYIGQLSHYYADISLPFHTTYDALNHDGLHTRYELAVDDLTRHPGDKPGWAVARAPQPVTDIRAKTVAAAKYSRARYPDLLSAYSSSGSVSNATVSRITGEVLTRASNDLGDIIASVPLASGQAPAPTDIDVTMSRYNVAPNDKAGAFVKVVNAGGAPMEGVGVLLSWQVASGTQHVLAYTDSGGYAQYYQNVGSLPLMQTKLVIASVAASGKIVADSATFRATPRLKSGRAGVRTSISTHHPKRGTTVKASTRCVSTSGRPVAGLRVTFHWTFKSGTKLTYGTTDAKGVARTRLNIGQAKKGYRVKVIGRVQSGGSKRSSTATFVPK